MAVEIHSRRIDASSRGSVALIVSVRLDCKNWSRLDFDAPGPARIDLILIKEVSDAISRNASARRLADLP
jgi:hypothetical protein